MSELKNKPKTNKVREPRNIHEPAESFEFDDDENLGDTETEQHRVRSRKPKISTASTSKSSGKAAAKPASKSKRTSERDRSDPQDSEALVPFTGTGFTGTGSGEKAAMHFMDTVSKSMERTMTHTMDQVCRVIDDSSRRQDKLVELVLELARGGNGSGGGGSGGGSSTLKGIHDSIRIAHEAEAARSSIIVDCTDPEEATQARHVTEQLYGIMRWFINNGRALYEDNGHVFLICKGDEIIFHVNLMYTWLGSLYSDRFDFSQKKAVSSSKKALVKLSPKLLETAIAALCGGTVGKMSTVKFNVKAQVQKETVQELMDILPMVSNNRMVTYADALYRISYTRIQQLTGAAPEIPPSAADPASVKFGQHALSQQNAKVRMTAVSKGGTMIFGAPVGAGIMAKYPVDRFFHVVNNPVDLDLDLDAVVNNLDNLDNLGDTGDTGDTGDLDDVLGGIIDMETPVRTVAASKTPETPETHKEPEAGAEAENETEKGKGKRPAEDAVVDEPSVSKKAKTTEDVAE